MTLEHGLNVSQNILARGADPLSVKRISKCDPRSNCQSFNWFVVRVSIFSAIMFSGYACGDATLLYHHYFIFETVFDSMPINFGRCRCHIYMYILVWVQIFCVNHNVVHFKKCIVSHHANMDHRLQDRGES